MRAGLQQRLATRMLAVAISTLFLGACSGLGSKGQADKVTTSAIPADTPVWAITPPVRSGMAYGVGSVEALGDPADAVRRAGEVARIDLLSRLRVTITGDISSTTTESSGTGREAEVTKNVRQYMRSQVPEVQLDELTIRDAQVSGGYAYALAELDRAATSARLRQQIFELEQQLDQYAQVTPQGNTLQQLRVMLPAMGLIAERQAFAEKLGLVAEDHRIPALATSHLALQQRVAELLNQLKVSIEFANPAAEAMAGELIEVLTSQGLNIGDPAQSDLNFTLTADRSERQQEGRFYAFVKARILIADQQGRTLSSFSDTGRGVSGLEQLAWQKASRSVADKLQQELAKTLTERLQ